MGSVTFEVRVLEFRRGPGSHCFAIQNIVFCFWWRWSEPMVREHPAVIQIVIVDRVNTIKLNRSRSLLAVFCWGIACKQHNISGIESFPWRKDRLDPQLGSVFRPLFCDTAWLHRR